MKTHRLNVDALQVSTFEVVDAKQVVAADLELRTPDSTCLFTQCPVTRIGDL